MRRAAKVDGNQREIVRALRDVGASVILTHQVGQGCPDAIVGFRGVNYLSEIKMLRGRLTDDQVALHNTWQGAPIKIIRSIDDALRMIGVIV